MIYRPPQVMHLAVDLHENLVKMPTPVRIATHPVRPFPADFSSKHRAKSVPPKADSFVADFDAALMQQVFDIS